MWIKLQHSLLTDPKVKKIKRASSLSIQEVLGILCCFWIWVDQHVDSSAATQIDDVGLLIEDFGGNEQFWEAVQVEGWLEFRDGEFYVGGWEKQFSKSAKQRAQTAARVASFRQRQEDEEEPCNAPPLHERYQSRGEERRGEESKEEKREENTPSSPPRGTSPDTLDPKKRSKKTVAYPSDFEAWYNAYPKRTAKKTALSAYGKALDSIQQEKGYTRKEATTFLLESAQAFAKSPDGRGQYVPYPSTWLNQGRYDDDREAWQRGDGKPKEHKCRPLTTEEIEQLNREHAESTGQDYYPQAFETWFAAYPKRTAKTAAFKAWSLALDRILGEKGGSPTAAQAFLLSAAQAYAKSPVARGSYVLSPAHWLDDGHYDDDPATWQSDSSVPKEFKNRMPNEEEIEALNRRYVTQQAPA